jgi:hypothetical protein
VRQLLESLGQQHAWAWAVVIGLGAYHGLNPGMGWLFAVSNGMQRRQTRGLFAALPPIAFGHLLAMAAALLPFALVAVYVENVARIRMAAGLILIAFGAYKLVSRRHPRFLARIGPSHLVLWSFLMATAHGAGLMLVPVVLDLCTVGQGTEAGGHGAHDALLELASGDLGIALTAATAHTGAMVLTGGVIAWIVYRCVGLGLLRRAWVNFDLLWAAMLIVVGAAAFAAAL